MPTSKRRNALVYYRIFPITNAEWDLIKIENSTIYVKSSQDISKDNKGLAKYWECKSDGIFNNSSQEFVYSRVTEGLLNSILEGHNGIILGFGQTGTGKSFTLTGLQSSEAEFGIAPRLIIDLFKRKAELPRNIKMSIYLSYTEFSKSNVVDLLKDFPNSIDPWHVKNALRLKVSSEFEALKLLYKGEGRKLFANNDEYMSHICTTVLTIHITTANQDFTCPKKMSSKLHIIDMAGVDSLGNASSNFKNPLDVGRANIIKSNMEQFILYLMQNIPKHIQVKERTNPLIYYLGQDLSQESILRFIGHIKIHKPDFRITTSTLRFGQLVRGLRPKLKEIEPEINEKVKFQYLQNKIDSLQKEKIYHSVLMNQDLTLDLNQDRMEHIQATVDAYLQNRISELNILNVAEATEAFKILKGHCNVPEEDKKNQFETDSTKHRHSSKTSSKTSLIKNIKALGKRPRKSKESLNTFEKGKHLDSIAPVYPKRSVLISQSRLGSSSGSQIGIKRIKSFSTSLGKLPSVIISRKSTTGSSLKDKTDSRKDMAENILIPESIPTFDVAWNAFINDPKCAFRIHSGPYRANESELKKVFLNYQKEMKNLQIYKEIVDKRRNKLVEAKMYQQFITIYGSEDTTTDSEKVCQENLNSALARLQEQQETVLRVQSELKILLNNRREIKKHLREDFDQYCKDNFNVVIPNIRDDMGEEEEILLQEQTLNLDTRKSSEAIEERSTQKSINIRLEKLKKIMERELRRNMKLREIQDKKWKNVY